MDYFDEQRLRNIEKWNAHNHTYIAQAHKKLADEMLEAKISYRGVIPLSLDISVMDKDGHDIVDFNTLRNPFGLINWTEHNCPMDTVTAGVFSDLAEERGNERPKDNSLLWYVCNHWNYDKADKIDRKFFKDIVDWYAEKVNKLEEGYFFFDVGSYRKFVETNQQLPREVAVSFASTYLVPQVTGSYCRSTGKFRITMTEHNCRAFNLGHWKGLFDYKQWFQTLVEIANLLQNHENKFYCSN